MKRTLLILSTAFLIVTLFTQCRKENRPDGNIYDTNFYTLRDTSKGKMYLYIDGQPKGELSWFEQNPGCDDIAMGDMSPLLNVKLKSGTYLIEGKDAKGIVLSSGEIFVSINKMSSSGGTGGQYLSYTEECVMIGLSE